MTEFIITILCGIGVTMLTSIAVDLVNILHELRRFNDREERRGD